MIVPRGFKFFFFAWAVSAAVLLPMTVGGASNGVLTLDAQAVFCSYYSLSGEDPEDLDIEELCWDQGRPTFSSFKPAEMFSKKSLLHARRELERQIRLIGRDTVFRWEPELSFVRNAFRLQRGQEGLPQATEFIQAAIPAKEWKLLEHALKDISSTLNAQSGESPMAILLKPVGAEERLETRNIARHDVAIPLRFVLFKPVSVETRDDEGNPRLHVLQ